MGRCALGNILQSANVYNCRQKSGGDDDDDDDVCYVNLCVCRFVHVHAYMRQEPSSDDECILYILVYVYKYMHTYM